MRGMVAKELRKAIYGDRSRRNDFRYEVKSTGYFHSLHRFINTGTMLVCSGLRKFYREAKRYRHER